jgi:hypothetical protein
MKRRKIKKPATLKRYSAEARDRIEAIEGIRRGLESMERNSGKPAEKFFQEFFEEKDISEQTFDS